MDHILLHDNDNGTHYPSYTLLCKDQPLLPSKGTLQTGYKSNIWTSAMTLVTNFLFNI